VDQPTPDGRVERGRLTRERIVAAGRELFGERGYDATSIDVVLARAGVARGALYHHFATKKDLFDAVLDAVSAEIAGTVADAARAAGNDPFASLRAGCDAWLRMALDPSVQRITLIDAPAVVGWTRWRQLDEHYTLGGVRRSLRRIARQGRLGTGDVDLLAHMILAAVNEAALFIARADDAEAALVTGRASVDTLLTRLVGE
jgi:AcrR family transcriptional regulator